MYSIINYVLEHKKVQVLSGGSSTKSHRPQQGRFYHGAFGAQAPPKI